MAKSNNAPKVFWFRQEQVCGCFRSRLYVDGRETPFFIDDAHSIGHRSQGDKYGLYGSGMGKLIERARVPYRIAALLDSGKRVGSLKHRAEQMAMGA